MMNVFYKYFIVILFAAALQNSFAQECGYVYVSPNGVSSGTAGTKATPANFAYGLTLINSTNKIMRMASGTYSLTAPLSIPSNITIEGGFNVSTWIKSNATPTIINRDNSNIMTGPNRLIGLSCVNVSGFHLLDLTINVADAVGDGVSVYAIYINNCTNYVISRCKINAGNGSDGLPGAAGTPGMNGAVGSAGETGEDIGEHVGNTGNCCRAGGVGASGSFTGSYGGGAGGTGGSQGGFVLDTLFGFYYNKVGSDYTNDGLAGLFGLGYGGVPGGNGGAGVCQAQYYQQCKSSPTTNYGKAGHAGIDGLPGHVGAQGIATYTTGYYTPGTGTIGTQGKNGGGGGGGGGGGAKGCQIAVINPTTGDTISYVSGSGAGGGGGGEGGQGGFTAFGGTGAGASFALFVWANGINGVVRDCSLTPGQGGAGGAGGTGGAGGIGGLGGLGGNLMNDSLGLHSCDTGEGGPGGQGGQGGQGGNGGKGSDGPSTDLYQQPGQELVMVSNMYNPFEPTVTAEFSGCSNSTVTFTTVATGNINWVFGVGANPATASGATVTVQYDSGTPGFRSITLIIDGVPYPLANFINIPTDFPPPQITASKSVVCIGDPVNFSTTGTAVTYNWSIPGGSTSTSSVQNPGNATFTTVGTHTVTLTTTSCCGVSITTKDIQVISAPTVNVGRDTTMCITDQKPLLDAGNPGASYQWTFNGTAIGGNTQTLQTTLPGTYSVNVSYGSCSASDAMVLTIYNHLPVHLGPDVLLCTTSTMPVLDAGIPNMQTYLWTMNSNPVGANTQILQSIAGGTYEVAVTSPTGCVGKDTVVLTIKDPVVELGNDFTICANGPHPILNAGNTGTASYSWRLNGVHVGGNTQTFQTTTAGVYAVTVTSTAGCSVADSLTLTILPALNAAFNVPATATVGSSVSFTDNSSPVPTAWDWSFGDGSANSTAQNPTHTYAAAGQYPVFLIINNTSCSDTITTLITIQNNCSTLGLTAAFHTSDDTVFLNGLGIINCTNTSANSEAWLWNFGDGSTSAEQNPSHVYTVSGTYTITLTSYNHNCSTTITSTVIVIKGAAGVNELAIEDYKLQIYPNPNDGKFTLQIEGCSECLGKAGDLTILNVLGEKVLQLSKINSSSVVVDLSRYPKGIYYVKLVFPASTSSANSGKNTMDEVIVKKVIVN